MSNNGIPNSDHPILFVRIRCNGVSHHLYTVDSGVPPALPYDIDKDMRQAYKGGFTYLNPIYEEIIVDDDKPQIPDEEMLIKHYTEEKRGMQ